MNMANYALILAFLCGLYVFFFLNTNVVTFYHVLNVERILCQFTLSNYFTFFFLIKIKPQINPLSGKKDHAKEGIHANSKSKWEM